MATNIYYTSNSVDRNREVVETITTSGSLSSAQSGNTLLVGTDALTITLPAVGSLGIGASADAAPAGTTYTFVNSGADGNNIITISPAAADGIAGTITLAASVVQLDGTVNKDAVNTKASALLGDSITIMSTGVTGVSAWVVTASTGIWAQGA
jgi:hypothetical protein